MEERGGRFYYGGELVTRFGFHNLRHGLGTWLAEQGTDPVVIQRVLRHSSQKMMEHYVHPKAREAQERYIEELGIAKVRREDDSGPHCGSNEKGEMRKSLKIMVARDGVEPPTPAFSGLRSTT